LVHSLVLVILTIILFPSRADSAESITIEAKDYDEKIVAVGLLQFTNETSFKAEVSGAIKSITVEEGAFISAGSILIEFDDANQGFQLEEMQASYIDAQAQYNQLVEFDFLVAKEELRRLTALKEQAKKTYENAMNLYKEGAISQSAMQESKAYYDTVVAQWTSANLKVKSLEQGGPLREAALSRVQGVKAMYDRTLETSSKYQIKVPWDSVLLKAYVQPEDYVQVGQLLAEIGEQGSYQVTTELDEKYFPYISKGLKASVFVGENRAEAIEGKINIITPKINENTGTFGVKIELPSEFPYQASDLTVNVEIKLKEQKDAITLSAQYLIEEEDDVYVYLFKNGTIQKTRIEIERGSSSTVLVLEGLQAGDVIVKPSPELEDGDSVKISKGAGAA
jgi:multidrug efflux pump subunit AcrA (membrane-fusion protein)